jgi:hypothetical protein
MAVVALVVLAEDELSKRVLEAREEPILVINEQTVIEEGQLAFQVVEVVQLTDLEIEFKGRVDLQHMFVLAQPIDLLEECLRGDFNVIDGVFTHT